MTGIWWATLPWFVALGMHGVLLFTPWWKSANLGSNSAGSGKVRVVESAAPPPPPTTAALQPLPQHAASALVVAKRQPPVPAKVPPKPPAPSPPQSSTARSPRVAAHLPPKSPSPTAKPARPQPTPQPQDLVVNLAQLPDTQPCQQVDGCWKSQTSHWRSVYAKVQSQITAQGYQVTELELEDDTGFRVSQIAKDGHTKYFLHLLSTLNGTIYILNPTQLSKEEVEQRLGQMQTG